jgi:hypothetical protein
VNRVLRQANNNQTGLNLKLEQKEINLPFNPQSTKNKNEVLLSLDAPSALTFSP